MIFPALFYAGLQNNPLRLRNLDANLIKDLVKCVCHRLVDMLSLMDNNVTKLKSVYDNDYAYSPRRQ